MLVPEEEMEAIQFQATSENVSVGEYVRRVLREMGFRKPSRSAAAKLASIREGAQCGFPTADIEDMNREIERGYRS